MQPALPYYYHWTWNLHSPPAALWPLAADTNRFNHDTGLPPVQNASPQRQPNARRRLRFRRLGVPIEWQEEPFEWIYPQRFGVVRRYTRGPVAEMRVRVTFHPSSEGGTRLDYEVWAAPRNLLGRLAIPLQIGWLSARQFEAVFREYDRRAGRPEGAIFSAPGARLAPGGRARLADARQRLVQAGFAPELVDDLFRLIEHADDLSLAQLRPYALAGLWRRPRRKTLELFLWATRLGVLEFRWEPLCPHCRRTPGGAASLHDLHPSQHCPTCNIDFTANFDQTVELTFRPSPAVRMVPEGQKFCVAGPGTTPHVVAQQLLGPGERRSLEAGLEVGHYHLRLMELPGAQAVRVTPQAEQDSASGAAAATRAETGTGAPAGADSPQEAVFRAGPQGWEACPPSGQSLALSTASRLVFENAGPAEQLFILERSAWNEQAALAADVTALQTFRDLFASEALRPEEPISVGSLAIVFTDLRGSTRLYREIGDAPAFGSVMEHFDVLREEVAAGGGAVVKTIGDAVMAVFRRPAEALDAMLRAQGRLASPPRGKRPLYLKAAIQYGPAIAVNANQRMDYFGSQVNMAARMVELSSGEDVIVAESVFHDVEAAALIVQESLQAVPFQAEFKGFDQEVFTLWRVMHADRPK